MIALLEAEALLLPPEAPAIEYVSLRRGGIRETVRGIAVGYWAVRRSLGEPLHDFVTGTQCGLTDGWVVDHVPTGICAVAVADFELALFAADELSIAVGSLAKTSSAARIVEVFTPFEKWVDGIETGGAPLRYRDWLSSQPEAQQARAAC